MDEALLLSDMLRSEAAAVAMLGIDEDEYDRLMGPDACEEDLAALCPGLSLSGAARAADARASHLTGHPAAAAIEKTRAVIRYFGFSLAPTA